MSGSSNRVGAVLVTGAAKRIGRAIALDFADQGWSVAVHFGTSADEAAATAAEISARGGRALTLAADLATEAEVEALVPRAVEGLGPLTCLVNSASTFEMDEPHTATRDFRAR